MRTYFADIEGMEEKYKFLYNMNASSDDYAIDYFKKVFGDRLHMVCIKGREKDKYIPVYEKPGLFAESKGALAVDYKSLLIKYIKHIVYNEGVSFVDDKYKTDILSERELEEIRFLEKQNN